MTQELAILTGSTAGATESFVVVPFELVKIKLQDKHSTYAGPIDVLKSIVKKDGLLGQTFGLTLFLRQFTVLRQACMLERSRLSGGEWYQREYGCSY